MKKKKNIEMKIYELLGIKVFRKMAFTLRDILAIPITIGMSKEERKNLLYKRESNYNLGKVKSLEDIKKFKKYLFMNAGIHIWGLSCCLPGFLQVISGSATLSATITNLISIGINSYCIMLQRYNNIRINEVIKKMTPKYEKQKNRIKEELRKEDSLLLEHSYKIIDKKETNVSLEDLIANANIEQLNQYRKNLLYFQRISQIMQENESYSNGQEVEVSAPIEKNKTLELKLRNNKLNKSANN